VVRGFVPPHTQIFQGEISNTLRLAVGFFIAANLSIMSLYVSIIYYAFKIFDWLRQRNNAGG
jgi:hypothetical protein